MRTTMRHLSVLIVGALLVACQDDLPTSLDSRPAPRTTPAFEASVGPAAAAHLAIDDAVDRIVPTLSDASSEPGKLGTSLSSSGERS